MFLILLNYAPCSFELQKMYKVLAYIITRVYIKHQSENELSLMTQSILPSLYTFRGNMYAFVALFEYHYACMYLSCTHVYVKMPYLTTTFPIQGDSLKLHENYFISPAKE